MADDNENDDVEQSEESTEKTGKGKLKLYVIIAALLLGGGGAGAYFYLNSPSAPEETADVGAQAADEEEDVSDVEADGEEEETLGTPFYFSLDPPFIVNFVGKSKANFLQVNVEGLTRDAAVKGDITTHMPQIRNNIVMLLSSQKYEDLITPEGKETLRKAVLKEIKKILMKETGKDEVEDVFFTSFVMQ